MTTYYWIVTKENHREPLAQIFKDSAVGAKGVFWCAADAKGKPVLFNHATTSPQTEKVAGTATLVGQADKTKVLVDPNGSVQAAGFEYCRAAGIRATAADIYAHARENMSAPSAPVQRLTSRR